MTLPSLSDVRTQRAFVFVSGLACAFAIVAIARLADTVSARRFIVPEAHASEPDFDWRETRRARVVHIPDGPDPEIEVRIGGAIEVSPRRRVIPDGDRELALEFLAAPLDAGPGTVGVVAWEGSGYSGTQVHLRFGPIATDVLVRIEDFRDFGPPFESVWSHVRGTIRLSSWPIERGVSVIGFELEGRIDEEARSFSGAFVAPR